MLVHEGRPIASVYLVLDGRLGVHVGAQTLPVAQLGRGPAAEAEDGELSETGYAGGKGADVNPGFADISFSSGGISASAHIPGTDIGAGAHLGFGSGGVSGGWEANGFGPSAGESGSIGSSGLSYEQHGFGGNYVSVGIGPGEFGGGALQNGQLGEHGYAGPSK